MSFFEKALFFQRKKLTRPPLDFKGTFTLHVIFFSKHAQITRQLEKNREMTSVNVPQTGSWSQSCSVSGALF